MICQACRDLSEVCWINTGQKQWFLNSITGDQTQPRSLMFKRKKSPDVEKNRGSFCLLYDMLPNFNTFVKAVLKTGLRILQNIEYFKHWDTGMPISTVILHYREIMTIIAERNGRGKLVPKKWVRQETSAPWRITQKSLSLNVCMCFFPLFELHTVTVAIHYCVPSKLWKILIVPFRVLFLRPNHWAGLGVPQRWIVFVRNDDFISSH